MRSNSPWIEVSAGSAVEFPDRREESPRRPRIRIPNAIANVCAPARELVAGALPQHRSSFCRVIQSSFIAAAPLPARADPLHNGARGGRGEASPGPGEVQNGSDHDGLLAELYVELRARAERFMRGQPRDQTLQTTVLVHEACMKLFGQERLKSADRVHLLALASTAMRSVLVDQARARGRVKRLPPGARVPIDEIQIAYEDRAIDLVALDEALEKLRTFDPVMARAVDLRFFGGLSQEDTARALDVPLRTLERHWEGTRAWLRAEIG